MSATASQGTQTASVSWTAPTGVDNSGTPVSIIQSLQSPVTLGEGTYTVNVIGFDAAGQSSTCTFKINVKGKVL